MMNPVRRPFLVLIAAAATAVGVPAAAATVQAWVVDKANSEIAFKTAYDGKEVDGVFQKWTADIAFDPMDLADSKAVVSIDPASATTGDSTYDGSIGGPDFFDTAKFPQAAFTTTGFKSLGGDKYVAEANLTIHGVTKAIEMPFTVTFAGDQAKMAASLSLRRDVFGVGQGDYAFSIPPDVTVNVAVAAHRAK